MDLPAAAAGDKAERRSIMIFRDFLTCLLACFVTMNELIPFVPFPGSVTAVTTKISPTPPWVMKILSPLRI